MSAGHSETQGDGGDGGGGGKTTLSVTVAPNHCNHGSFSATTIVPTFDGPVFGSPRKKVVTSGKKQRGILRSIIVVASILYTFKITSATLIQSRGLE